MLDIERVIRRSTQGDFDTVAFFNYSPELIAETQSVIPGALGFPGDFLDIVTMEDPSEPDDSSNLPFEDAVRELADVRAERVRLNRLTTRRDFQRQFPFDVLNLDLEGYPFKLREPVPGKLLNALRTLLRWQQQPLPPLLNSHLGGFTLFLTTKVGPTNMGDPYLEMLRHNLNQNMTADGDLERILIDRTGHRRIAELEAEMFAEFFKLATPKILARVIREEDWYVDPADGIQIWEFDRRPPGAPAYTMLHMAMDIRRQNPPRHRRAIGTEDIGAVTAYTDVVRRIFSDVPTAVTPALWNEEQLKEHLRHIRARGEGYQQRR
jgi:hypothetical protein